MLLTLVLTRSYSSNLISLLTVRYIPQPFQTLSNLLDSPATTMIWEANTAYVQYYKSVESGVFFGVRRADEEGRIKFVKSTEYDFTLDHLVRPGTHAFIFEDLTARILKASDFSRTGPFMDHAFSISLYLELTFLAPYNFCFL
ncbi:hypothetical protein Pmani_002252 [Petrolisthes manimaculis]|uniref:Uncharacterized protein n=1 Tax=Petrolisthes manimaculis TaxID=1843537 RepID=A0AAE1QJ15_9EUCA|nr:hypothetical protein Pmani_002252 [Petrolisthes manimaculis]